MTYESQQKPEQVTRIQAKLRALGGDYDRLADEMDTLWANPSEFERTGIMSDDPDDLMTVFYLGVCFGTDYEHAYPRDQGANDPDEVAAMDGLNAAARYCDGRGWDETAAEINRLYQRVGRLGTDMDANEDDQ